MKTSTSVTKEEGQAAVMTSTQDYDARMKRIEDHYEQIMEIHRFFAEDSKAALIRSRELDSMKQETERLKQETERAKKGAERAKKEAERAKKETERLMRETWAQMKDTDKKIKELSTRFGSTTGHIIEGLMAPAAFKMLQDAGFHVNRCYKNLKRKSKDPEMAMEIDELLLNDTVAIAVEVKTSCDSKDIDNFLERMKRFKTLYPENKDKDVYVAIAAVNYERDADTYAHKCGLLVIRASEDIFTLDSHEGDGLRVF